MRRRLAIASIAFAWLCANDAIWNATQVFAWGRMFAGYAQKMSLADAARETLDPDKPCPICLTVAQAEETARQQAPQTIERSSEKLLLACEMPAKIELARPVADWPDALSRVAVARTEPVPVPPPRV